MTGVRSDATVCVIVPTFNESANVVELVRRLTAALDGTRAEILFVDDSTDDTPDVVRAVAADAAVPVRLIHRDAPVGGLSGAVRDGLAATDADVCVVMDGDLQHPPEVVPVLLEALATTGADVVVASRYTGDGSSTGLAGRMRHAVSSASTSLTRAMFPVKLRDCSDPMTGYFAVRRAAVDVTALHPRGFKILLEILARHRLSVAEVPFVFAERYAGDSKASVRQGLHFLHQLTSLRFGRMSRFAVIGAFGALVNVAMVAGLTHVGLGTTAAAVIAAETTIVMNFLLQERFVFRDLRHEGRGVWHRFAASVGFNNIETVVRLPVVVYLVNAGHVTAWLATAVTLLVAFVLRFVFHSRVVYRPRATRRPGVGDIDPSLADTSLEGTP